MTIDLNQYLRNKVQGHYSTQQLNATSITKVVLFLQGYYILFSLCP